MRVILIHNPVAGMTARSNADELLQLIRKAGHEVTYCSSQDLHREPERCDLIAIAGGDGTAGRIARKLVGCSTPITFLPVGTANNIARTFELADRPLEQLIAGWDRGTLVPLDIGLIESPWGSRDFIEGVGAGLFVRMMIEIDSADALGHLASPNERVSHALTLVRERLATFPARHLNLKLDGSDLSGEYLMIEVMNIRFIGPNLYVAPAADPTDGLFDIVLVEERERAALQSHIRSWQEGCLQPPELKTYRGKHLHLEWQGSALHVDDEAWPPEGTTCEMPARIDIHARAAALQLLLPQP